MNETGPNDSSFLQLLFNKLADTIRAGQESGGDTGAAQQEVFRQMSEVSRAKGGDPISGNGVTKSGGDD